MSSSGSGSEKKSAALRIRPSGRGPSRRPRVPAPGGGAYTVYMDEGRYDTREPYITTQGAAKPTRINIRNRPGADRRSHTLTIVSKSLYDLFSLDADLQGIVTIDLSGTWGATGRDDRRRIAPLAFNTMPPGEFTPDIYRSGCTYTAQTWGLSSSWATSTYTYRIGTDLVLHVKGYVGAQIQDFRKRFEDDLARQVRKDEMPLFLASDRSTLSTHPMFPPLAIGIDTRIVSAKSITLNDEFSCVHVTQWPQASVLLRLRANVADWSDEPAGKVSGGKLLFDATPDGMSHRVNDFGESFCAVRFMLRGSPHAVVVEGPRALVQRFTRSAMARTPVAAPDAETTELTPDVRPYPGARYVIPSGYHRTTILNFPSNYVFSPAPAPAIDIAALYAGDMRTAPVLGVESESNGIVTATMTCALGPAGKSLYLRCTLFGGVGQLRQWLACLYSQTARMTQEALAQYFSTCMAGSASAQAATQTTPTTMFQTMGRFNLDASSALRDKIAGFGLAYPALVLDVDAPTGCRLSLTLTEPGQITRMASLNAHVNIHVPHTQPVSESAPARVDLQPLTTGDGAGLLVYYRGIHPAFDSETAYEMVFRHLLTGNKLTIHGSRAMLRQIEREYYVLTGPLPTDVADVADDDIPAVRLIPSSATPLPLAPDAIYRFPGDESVNTRIRLPHGFQLGSLAAPHIDIGALYDGDAASLAVIAVSDDTVAGHQATMFVGDVNGIKTDAMFSVDDRVQLQALVDNLCGQTEHMTQAAFDRCFAQRPTGHRIATGDKCAAFSTMRAFQINDPAGLLTPPPPRDLRLLAGPTRCDSHLTLSEAHHFLAIERLDHDMRVQILQTGATEEPRAPRVDLSALLSEPGRASSLQLRSMQAQGPHTTRIVFEDIRSGCVLDIVAPHQSTANILVHCAEQSPPLLAQVRHEIRQQQLDQLEQQNEPPATAPSADAGIDDSEPALSEYAPARLRNLPSSGRRAFLETAMMLQSAGAILQAKAPSYAASGAAYMEEFVLRRFGLSIHAETTYLARYQPARLQAWPTAWRVARPGPEHNPQAGRLMQAQTLAEIAITHLPYADFLTLDVGPDFRRDNPHPRTSSPYVICEAPVPERYTAGTASLIEVAAFAHAVRNDFDFAGRYSEEIRQYYAGHGPAMRQLMQLGALFELNTQYYEGSIGEQDYQFLRRALEGSSREAAIFVLDIQGYHAIDCLRIVDKRTGRTCLYLSGDDPPMRMFASREQAIAWLRELGRQEDIATAFATKHFSCNDAQPRIGSAGVAQVLRHESQRLSADVPLYFRFKTSPRDAPRRFTYLDSRDDIVADPFGKLLALREQGDQTDARYDITTASDVDRLWWREAASYIPLDFVGDLIGLWLSKTPRQQEENLFGIRIDAIVRLLGLALPSGGVPGGKPAMPRVRQRGTSIRWQGSVSVPGVTPRRLARQLDIATITSRATDRVSGWFRMPVRANGRIGYLANGRDSGLKPLSTTMKDPLEFDMNGAAAMLRKIEQNGFASLPQPLKEQVMHVSERLEVAARTRLLRRPAALARPPSPRLPQPLPTTAGDIIDAAFAAGRGLVIGEVHLSTASRAFVSSQLDYLQRKGVKTFYTEDLLFDVHGPDLDRFNLSGELSPFLLNALAEIDTTWKIAPTAPFSLPHLYRQIQQAGMQVVALDNLASSALDYRVGSNALRQRAFNYVAYRRIEKTCGNTPWVALVGARHAGDSGGVNGIAGLTGAVSVKVGYRSDQRLLDHAEADMTLILPATSAP